MSDASDPTQRVNPKQPAPTSSDPTLELPLSPRARPEKAEAPASPPLPLPQIPEVELEAEIGRGGMGVVYRGRQSYLDRRVAVKLLLVENVAKPKEFVDRFRREAKILAGLAHANIVSCYQAGTTPGAGDCYIVMEFIDGPSLRAWIDKNGPLDEAAALEVARDVALALDHANARGIMHRDVKPENVLLQRLEKSGALFPFKAKLVDLGLAVPHMGGEDATRITAAGVVLGTPATMAPEQFDDPDHVDFRADIYGLGCVLFHALTGKAAFPERTVSAILLRKASGEVPDPRALRAGIGEGARALVRGLLAARREDRPQSYADVVARCEALLAEPPGAGPSATQPFVREAPPPAPALARRRSRAPLLLLLAVLLGGGAAALVHFRPLARRGPDAPERPVVFAAKGEPLFASDQAKRVAAWRQIGRSSWGTDLDADDDGSVAGVGKGRIARDLGPGPWRVEGVLMPLEPKTECGVRVDFAGGRGVGVAIQRIQKYLATLRHFGEDLPSGEPNRVGPIVASESIAEAKELRFAVAAEGAGLRFELGGANLHCPLRPEDGAPVGISLYVNGPAARFKDVVVRRP